jgi:signal transduction histidine kinase
VQRKDRLSSPTGLDDPQTRAAYAYALVPPDLPDDLDRRARQQAAEFCELVRRHISGDATALTDLSNAVWGAAAEMLQHGAEPGMMLERLDAGRRLVLRAIDRSSPEPGTLSALDDRLAEIQVTSRRAIIDAITADDAVIDAAVVRALGPDSGRQSPDELMDAATESFRVLVGGDTSRLWLDRGGGTMELVASAGRSVIEHRLFASAEKGSLAEFLRSDGPTLRARPSTSLLESWRELIPDLDEPLATLAAPLRLAERPFGVIYAVRHADGAHPEPFRSADTRSAARFIARIEPAIAWSHQARTAQHASEAGQDFLRLTTHELRRPLAVLRGYVDMLTGATPADAVVFSERIARAAEQLSALLSEVSDTARVEDPLRPLHFADHRVGDIVNRVVAAASDEAGQCGCRLEVRISDPEATVQCDVHHLEHAIANLLSNAFGHTGRGTVVRLRAGRRGRRSWRITVRDNGPGFPDAEGERLFDKYYRALPATGNGSGLGLYYVRMVAERHGGNVAAANLQGGGAEFSMVLPVSPGSMPWGG